MNKLLDAMKKNIGFVIGCVICAGGIGWIGWRAWDAYSRQQQAAEDLDQALSRLDRLHKRKPYPHVDNLATLSNNFDRITGTGDLRGADDWLDTLVARNPTLNELTEAVNKSGFNAALVQRQKTLLAKARDNAVAVPQDFGFGFGRYVKEGVAPTNNADGIRLLLTQWSAVETISQVLFSNRVERIDGIRRATFDIGRDPAAGAGQLGEESITAPIRDTAGEVTRSLPFEFTFLCDTDSLRGVLASLTAAKPFLVVRSVEVTSDQSARMLSGGRPEELGRALSAAAAAAAAPPAEAESTPPAEPSPGAPGDMPPPPPTRQVGPMLVFGMEKLNVKMRVDLVEFRKPAAPQAQ
jgi:hypothetical protein